jgi:carboxymethylenebutenolidase
MGFSMGTGFALMLDEHFPEAFSKIVLFYGGSGADVTNSKAHYLAHFAETDEFEPLEEVQKTKGPNLVKHIYPGTGHWFFESDRSAFDPAAAQTAWERSLVFLKE